MQVLLEDANILFVQRKIAEKKPSFAKSFSVRRVEQGNLTESVVQDEEENSKDDVYSPNFWTWEKEAAAGLKKLVVIQLHNPRLEGLLTVERPEEPESQDKQKQ